MMPKLSLIPYLEPGNGKFSLNIDLPYPTTDSEEYSPYPFQLLNDAEPFSRLFKAGLVSEGKQSISPLFLLVQRDSYRYAADEIWPLCNPDLDKYWQQTFSYISTTDNLQNRFFPLKDTISPEGMLIPFHSLFFCTFKKRFFHPPCPICGKHLELCKNDDLLSSNNLMPYSTTIKRYLFCPSCQQNNTTMYTYIRKDTDPPIIRDFHGLVRSWRNIAAGQIESQIFPCADCRERTACFGEKDLSCIRIVPFIFYPSYILAFEANSMSAVDFLPLISGAAVDELIPSLKKKNQQGRLSCLLEWQRRHGSGSLFLYDGKAEQFLEILYLKLSFLCDVARILLTPGAAPIPVDISTAIDCIWVNLPNHNSLLPGLWNFKVNLFTVGSCGTDADTLPISHPSQTCYCLGIIWFFTLLRNKNQPDHIIKEALKQILEHPTDPVLVNKLPAFASVNIFWNPDARHAELITAKGQNIWEQVILIGAHLIKGNYSETVCDDGIRFFSDLEKIRKEIKQLLFEKKKETSTVFSNQPADDNIRHILLRILKRWESDEMPPPPPPRSKEEILTQTVILTKNSATDLSKSAETASEKAEPSTSTEEVLGETIILKTNATSPKISETIQSEPPPGETEELQETVILKTRAAPPKMSETIQNAHFPGRTTVADEKDEIPETLILKPSYTKDKQRENE